MRHGEHSLVVARYAELTARELGLPEEVVQDVRLAGLLHDVGKSGVADAIVSKPASLTGSEWIGDAIPPGARRRPARPAGLDDVREWILLPPRAP